MGSRSGAVMSGITGATARKYKGIRKVCPLEPWVALANHCASVGSTEIKRPSAITRIANAAWPPVGTATELIELPLVEMNARSKPGWSAFRLFSKLRL